MSGMLGDARGGHSLLWLSLWLVSPWGPLIMSPVVGEMFTSLAQLEGALREEHSVAHSMRSYISSERDRLHSLSRIADELEEHSETARADPEFYLGNPAHAFLMLKRFAVDWHHTKATYLDPAHDSLLEDVLSGAAHFPASVDLTGAAHALIRLQDTYTLSAANLARGHVQGATATLTMSADDAFELGRQAYNGGDYYHALMWMQVALDLIGTEAVPTTNRAQLLDYMAYATFKQGNIHHAKNLTLEWLELEPAHERAQTNLHFYAGEIRAEEERRRRERVVEFSDHSIIKNERVRDEYRASPEFDKYERLCRDPQTWPASVARHLTCQYLHHHPLFILTPAKEEVMYLDPRIVIYHDLMTPAESQLIRDLSTSKLHRSGVFTYPGGNKQITQDYRTSQSAWLRDDDSPGIARLSRRTSALTGLSLETVEDFQVVNYGIGGHYEPHYDFARPSEKSTFEDGLGNRIITAIYYVEAPNAGGATVFPDLGVKLLAEKGACAVWHNLLRNGEGDYRTKHAGCPTLTGTKWIANKWYHERGQEFNRPCSLRPDE